jgi:hypothetical protein
MNQLTMNFLNDMEPSGGMMTSSSLEGSRDHANPIQSQESEKGKRMNATSGRKCLEQFEKFNRPGLWAKTFAELLIGQTGWYSMRCRLNWKLKGTKSSRFYFQLQVSTLPMKDIEHGLLPTPVVSTAPYQYSNGDKTRPKTLTLIGKFQAGMLPTPKTTDIADNHGGARMGVNGGFYRENSERGANLADVVKLMPTPTFRDYRSGFKEGSDAFNARQQNPRGVNLHEHLQRELDGKNFQLNPQFVLEMMGFPPDWTELPFQNGVTNP